MSSLINATVKYQAKKVDTRYGTRVNVVLISDSGEEITYWSNPFDQQVIQLKKNQKIQLIKDNNNKLSIVTDNTAQEKPLFDDLSIASGWDETTKKSLCQDVKQLVEFYAFCTAQVKQKITDFKEEESIRTIATTVFIQAIRKI